MQYAFLFAGTRCRLEFMLFILQMQPRDVRVLVCLVGCLSALVTSCTARNLIPAPSALAILKVRDLIL